MISQRNPPLTNLALLLPRSSPYWRRGARCIDVVLQGRQYQLLHVVVVPDELVVYERLGKGQGDAREREGAQVFYRRVFQERVVVRRLQAGGQEGPQFRREEVYKVGELGGIRVGDRPVLLQRGFAQDGGGQALSKGCKVVVIHLLNKDGVFRRGSDCKDWRMRGKEMAGLLFTLYLEGNSNADNVNTTINTSCYFWHAQDCG